VLIYSASFIIELKRGVFMETEDMLKMIENLNDEEKQKFLDLIFDEYFIGGGAVRHTIENNETE
jgi:hypothetical protein